MIELILMILSMNNAGVDSTPICANLMYQQDVYVLTYKGKAYTGGDFYPYICNDDLVQQYVLDIKRGH